MYNGEFILANYGLDMQQWLWGEKYESSDEYWHVSQPLIFVCKIMGIKGLRYMYLPPSPHPKSSQNRCSPGSINGIFMNNINTGQLMEYNEDCTVVVLSKWSVFISFSVSSKSYNSVYRSQFYSTKEVSYDTSMMWHTVLSFKMIKLTSTYSFQHKRDTYSVLVSGWQKWTSSIDQ